MVSFRATGCDWENWLGSTIRKNGQRPCGVAWLNCVRFDAIDDSRNEGGLHQAEMLFYPSGDFWQVGSEKSAIQGRLGH